MTPEPTCQVCGQPSTDDHPLAWFGDEPEDGETWEDVNERQRGLWEHDYPPGCPE